MYLERARGRGWEDRQIRLISGCYVGEHKIHQYHGDGTLYLPNGGYLEGQFEDHMASGHGVHTARMGQSSTMVRGWMVCGAVAELRTI